MPEQDKRKNRRVAIRKQLRVRPSDPRDEHFEDMPNSVNASRNGIYFVSQRETYYKGMRMFITYPYNGPTDPMNCEYLAEVVRVEKAPGGKTGVALHLLMTMNMGGSSANQNAPKKF